MKQFILSSIFIFISITIFSQNLHNLNGKVTNEKNGQVTVGDVLLLHNNSIVKYTSINNGNFLFEAILQGNYTLKISGLGYETYIQKVILDKNLQLTVTLKEELQN